MKIPFTGNILILGAGAVSQCFQLLLIKHLDVDFTKIQILDARDMRESMKPLIERGARFATYEVTPDNYQDCLRTHLSSGGLLIDLSVNVQSADLIDWCHNNEVLYINTALENWPESRQEGTGSLVDKALYSRHLGLQERARHWSTNGPTAVIEHGANPGLVSHWTKQALEEITIQTVQTTSDRIKRCALERALADGAFPELAYLTGTKVIHISERDDQITSEPKRVNQFVNTWSIPGFHEEATAPAEIGWGTHERTLPEGAELPVHGPKNQLFLHQMGMITLMRSWVPTGEIIGCLIRHGEAFTISRHFTVMKDGKLLYRPTVHYVYLPCDSALASLRELRMGNFELQADQRMMYDDIIDGADHVGVLLLGHDLNGWWTGSELTIQETRQLIGPGQNATTLQVAASMLGALAWMIAHPREGLKVPDDLPYKEILAVANLYLGTCTSRQTDWNPRSISHPSLYKGLSVTSPEDIWQFESFRVR